MAKKKSVATAKVTINDPCKSILEQWAALENARVLLERAKQVASDRVAATNLLVEAAKQIGDMNQIMAAQLQLQAAHMLEQRAIQDLYNNSVEEYNLAAQANQFGCVLPSSTGA